MNLKDFDYILPEELIAQQPAAERDSSRLMVAGRSSGSLSHGTFADIAGYFRRGDVLVFNDTRVIPARLNGVKATGGAVELLLTRKLDDGAHAADENVWKCLARPGKGLKPGTRVFFDEGVTAEIIRHESGGFWLCRFNGDIAAAGMLEKIGRMPLPPYIKRDASDADKERYQTVYAATPGAVAAPTAGLHFTPDVLSRLGRMGVEMHNVTLHTGPGTFMPVRVDRIEDHRMHEEYYNIDRRVFDAIVKARGEKRRIAAVGTTTVRALESAAVTGLETPALNGPTSIFIYPGHRFNVVDALLTNFHLPCSTLLMLVSAFAGRENIMNAYAEAVKERYRFFSYGDAMFIL